MSKPTPSAWRDLYERIAPVLVVFALLSAVSAVGWSFQNSRANAEQDRQRIDLVESFTRCFNAFGTTLAGGLPPVREATATLNEATATLNAATSEALITLQHLLLRAIEKKADEADAQALVNKLDAVKSANAAVQAANDNLTQVRAENPYPEPPTEFCDLSLPS